ncbi:MAG: sensor histidine kinase [Anaerosomatales bacterium]|nr:sensor histidine kinase [Anaerosomatales bacterium]
MFGQTRRGILDDDLIGSLHEVAAAVSSYSSVDDILDAVVDRAKRITSTEKAVLCLMGDADPLTVDRERLSVRGSRDRHDEAWWAAQLELVASDVLDSGHGTLVRDRRADASLFCVPVKLADRPIGLLAAINSYERSFSSAETSFLAILGTFAAMSIENARLAERTRYALLAGERERIANEMHDGLSQSLFGVSLGLETCKRRVLTDPAAVLDRLGDLQDQLSSSMVELRRYIYDLKPSRLQQLGMPGAIEQWVHELTVAGPPSGHVVVLGEERRLDPLCDTALYAIAREAVTNVVKHADAHAFIVTISYEARLVELRVEDDGSGFEPDVQQAAAEEGGSLGLHTISQRARELGGTCTIVSAPGAGTEVRARIPSGGDR